MLVHMRAPLLLRHERGSRRRVKHLGVSVSSSVTDRHIQPERLPWLTM
ncbi:MAG: hypothetical protein QOD64_5 [Verrucomicrobiota bacterium]